jgi:glyoxylase-like metal-dependent hydrolase (beta-lactamase superfamily II)
MKRVLKWLGILVGSLLAVAAGLLYSAFGNNSAVIPGPVVPGVETVKDGFVNAFILDAGNGEVALVDAGNDRFGKALLGALERRHLTPASVAAIFLTHGHPDHTAGCKLFPHADVYAMEADIPMIGEAAKVTRPLKDGDVVAVADLRVEAFSVPGHTSGSAVYLARGVLFFGDSAGASKSGALMKAVRFSSKDSSQNVASLKALAARLAPRKAEIKAMAFGHSGFMIGLDPLSDFATQN